VENGAPAESERIWEFTAYDVYAALRAPRVKTTSLKLAQPDVTLVLDRHGVIREISLSDANPDDRADDLIGRPWADTVADFGGDKIMSMFEDARASRVSSFRQVTQRFPGGRELLLEYTTVRLGGSGGFIAVGRNLQAVADLQAKLITAQQTMERDYWKLRQVESRYRILFDASTEAVLLVSAGDLRIVEANPAAIRALGMNPQRAKTLIGRELLPELGAEDREPVQSALAQARELGRAPGILLHLGAERTPWTVRASLMGAEPGPLYLLQFVQIGTGAPGIALDDDVSIEDLVERGPDAFLVLDREGVIISANRAFLDLVQVGTRSQAVGERVGRWLGRPGADMTALLSTLLRHGVVRLFSTTIHGELGIDTEIEISAVLSSEEEPTHVGMMLRDVGRRLAPISGAEGVKSLNLPAAEQVGKSTLRKLVKDTVQVVERHYVEAALQMTGGNRSAAAELLGLSRQNLYSKLDRYGLMGRADADQERDQPD
jgi:transcriptional regulator PpsR